MSLRLLSARALASLASLAVALWLGGLMALFLFVQSLFSADRPTAVRAAPVLFEAFGSYQLVLAGAAVVSAGLLWAIDPEGRRRWAAGLGLLLVASAGAVAMAAWIGPAMERSRLAGDTAGFGRLHGAAMTVYLAETLAVLAAAGVLFIWPSRHTTGGTAPASASPAGPAGPGPAT